MRFACVVPAALLAMGCGVPDVYFTDAGGNPDDATPDSPQVDAPTEAPSGDAESDAEGDAITDAADAGDAATETGASYCKGDAGPPTGAYTCCMNGAVCSGTCNGPSCGHCMMCTWPSVCCTMGSMGRCSADGGC